MNEMCLLIPFDDVKRCITTNIAAPIRACVFVLITVCFLLAVLAHVSCLLQWTTPLQTFPIPLQNELMCSSSLDSILIYCQKVCLRK